jgi:hypothetical protein
MKNSFTKRITIDTGRAENLVYKLVELKSGREMIGDKVMKLNNESIS